MNGKNSDNRRGYRRRERDNESVPKPGKKNAASPKYDKNRGVIFERPRWTPPKMSAEPFPAFDCPYCGKPIRDLAAAIADKNTGEAVHFDCVIARISAGENLEKGDSVAYIGGGRFGVVHFNSSQDPQIFSIKKIVEWEIKENRADWRKVISDHYSVT
ncbi:MAG: hypothetical protein LBT95_01380 [Treponema sp.]|jgi:hypothetical protein|nr:hypothetical protein [Treponema sp.]